MIDWTKPIETTGGIPATFLKKLETTSACSHLVVFRDTTGEDVVVLVSEDGTGYIANFRNTKQKVSRFVLMIRDKRMPDGFSFDGYFHSEEAARKHAYGWTDVVIRKWTVEV